MKNTSTTEEFIKKARAIHGEKYDYSKTNYIGARIKVCITCPIHGDFLQRPNGHLTGYGCCECGYESTRKKISGKGETFIEKANAVYGGIYDYSLVEYTNNKTPVKIICKKHGIFLKSPDAHLNGQGCTRCSLDKKNTEKRLTNEEYISRAIKIHGNKYDYRKTNYAGYYKPVTIICKEHGEFTQLAYDHLHGKGCKKCKMSHLENKINQLLLLNGINFKYNYIPDFLKNGKSHRSLDFFISEIGVAIECQGKQHFSDSPFYKKTYAEAYERDLKKYEDCKKNGVRILYFSDISPKNYFDNVFNNEYDLINEIKKMYGKELL